MKRYVLLVILLFASLSIAFAQSGKRKLETKLLRLVKSFHGTAGIYVRHLDKDSKFMVNADSVFPTASMIKVPISIALLNRVERGELGFHQELVYRDSLLYPGEDLLGSFKDGEKITLQKLLMLMLTMSDNTASLWCQSLAGGGTAINTWLAEHRYDSTRVNSRTPGREAAYKRYGWGQTTPREMAELVAAIHDGKITSHGMSERLLRTLDNNYWDAEALSEIPPYVNVASKNGAVDRSRSEVAVVDAPHGAFVFCIITKNQDDTSWEPGNEGWKLIREVTSLLWNYFEPREKWKPDKEMQKYY